MSYMLEWYKYWGTFCHQQDVQFWLDQDFGSRSSRPPSCTRCWPHRWSFRAASSSPSCIGRSCERWLRRRLTWLLLEWPGWPAESRSRGPATQTPDSPFERTRTPFRQDPPLCAPEIKMIYSSKLCFIAQTDHSLLPYYLFVFSTGLKRVSADSTRQHSRLIPI